MMKRGLTRLLKVRQLLEERAGLELKAGIADLRQLEARAEEHRRLAIETRHAVLEQTLSAADSWLGMADAEIFSWKQQQAKLAARRMGEEVAAARERARSRRMETQQAAALVEKAEQAEDLERICREQQRIDDWYQSLPETRRSE